MPFDFSSYQVDDHEHPASAGKYNNLIFAVQKGLNAMPVANLVGYPGDAGKYLNGNAGWTLPSTDLVAVYRKTDETEVKDTVSATDLFGGSLAIAGGRLGTLGSIRISAQGTFKNDTGVDRQTTISLLLGGVPLWTSNPTFPADGEGRSWCLKVIVQAMGSVTSQQGGGTFLFSHTDKAAIGMGNIRASSAQLILGPFLTIASSVDMAVTQALALMCTHSVKNAELSMSCTRARVEVTV